MSGNAAPSRGQWLTLAAAFLGWMFDGVEQGLFPQVARPALKNLLHVADDAAIAVWNGRILACFLVGAAVGGVAFGWLGDKIGRVRAMALSILAYSLFTGACYFAAAPWQLGLFLFLAALGMGGQWSLAVALVVECWPDRHRPKLAGAIGAASNFGFLLIAVVAFSRPVTEQDWRWLMLVGAAPAVLALLIISFVPESERWKAAVKQGGGSPLVEIFRPGLMRKTLLGIALASVPLIVTWAAVSGWIPGWVNQMTEETAAKGMLSEEALGRFTRIADPQAKNAMLKSALTSAEWDQVMARSARAKASVQILLAIGAILGSFFAPLVCGTVGRRPAYFALCLLGLTCCECLCLSGWQYGLGFLAMAAVIGAATASFYGWLPLYLPELFPTRVRATAQGVSYNSGRLVAAAANLAMGQLVGLLGGSYRYAIATVALVYVVGLMVIWLAPETKGKPLPD